METLPRGRHAYEHGEPADSIECAIDCIEQVVPLMRALDPPRISWNARAPVSSMPMKGRSMTMPALTDHAVKRAQQRGISRGTIHLITKLADQRVRVAGGATALSISARARARWITDGAAPADLDRTDGIVLITDLTRTTVITVKHSYRKRRRCGR